MTNTEYTKWTPGYADARIGVYRDPATSEVEFETYVLAEALALRPSLCATISCNGTVLARSIEGSHWSLCVAGQVRLSADMENARSVIKYRAMIVTDEGELERCYLVPEDACTDEEVGRVQRALSDDFLRLHNRVTDVVVDLPTLEAKVRKDWDFDKEMEDDLPV